MTQSALGDFVERIQNRIASFRKGPLGVVIVGILAVLVLVNELVGLQLVPIIAGAIWTINPSYLALASLAFFAGLIFFPIQRVGVKLFLWVASALLFIPLIMSEVKPQQDDLVIVYDDASRNMYPEGLSTPAVDLAAIDRLMQVGTVGPDSLFLSLVERPVETWRPIFSGGFRPRLKILSLREVLENDDDLFVDVSVSDFVSEILHVVNSRSMGSGTYVVYSTESYQNPAALLEQSLRSALPSANVVSITYRGRRTGLIHPNDAVLIYLGSSSQFPDFVRHMATREYRQLVAPNWTAGEIDTRARPAVGSRPNRADSRGVLVMSSPARRLAEADFQQWSRVIDTVRMARQRRADLGSFVGNNLSRGMTIETIGFEDRHLLR